jgi:hypothetical protein
LFRPGGGSDRFLEGGAVGRIEPTPEPKPGHVWVVLVAWILVGMPLLWGVWNTLLKAAALFR